MPQISIHICVDLVSSKHEVKRALVFIREQLGNEVASRWYQIGVIIGVTVISAELRPELCRYQWLEGHALLPKTWQVLVDAVGHNAGGDYQVLAEGLSKNITTYLQG